MAAPGPGALVLAFLHSPKERVWGVLRGIDGAGVWIEGIDLDSFDDWARQVGRDQGPALGLSVIFYPLLRVEKILLDRTGPGQPSFADRFHGLVGIEVEQYLGLRGAGEGVP
jgi:hypothetical protein